MTSNIIIIPLIILSIIVVHEISKILMDMDKGKYIYSDIVHSIEHFTYLCFYLFSIINFALYYIYRDEFFLILFTYLFTISSIVLVIHVRKERNDK